MEQHACLLPIAQQSLSTDIAFYIYDIVDRNLFSNFIVYLNFVYL